MKSFPHRSFLLKYIFNCLILIELLFNYHSPVFGQSVTKKKTFTVVIDPGHGGKDPGTVWKKVYEKDIALGIALKFGNYIKNNLPDVKVIFTRQTDVFIDLDKRAPVANKNQADIFISIHVNSNDKNPRAEGTETYFMGSTKTEGNLDVARKENAAIRWEDDYATKYEGYSPDSPNSFILFSLLQNTHWKQSLQFANYVQTQFANHAKRTNRGIKQAGFLVLWRTAVPSVLIETGFLTNEEDRKTLTSNHGQDLLAAAIFKAFCNYKNDIENHSVSTNGKYQKDSLPISDDTEAPAGLPDSIVAGASEHTDIEKITTDFLVQIMSSKKPIPLNSHHFKGLKNVEEIRIDDYFKYAVGRKSSFHEVLEYSKVVRNYFPDAFIIAVRNGKIIPVKDALKEIKN